jgi:hypothetical protein
VAVHNLKLHINGLSQVPVNPHPLVAGQPPLTQAEEEEVEAYQKELGKWTVGEATIQNGLSKALPPALYLTV